MVWSGLRRLVKHVAPGGPAYRRALLSDVVSAAALGAVGDVICQIGAEGVSWQDLDKRRVIALTVFSSAYIGELAAIAYSASKWLTTLTAASRFLDRRILPSCVQSLSCLRLGAGRPLEGRADCTEYSLPHTECAAGERDRSERPWLRNPGQSALWRYIYPGVFHRRWTASGRFVSVRDCQPAQGVVDHIRRLHRVLASLHVVQLSVCAGGAARAGDGIGQPRMVCGD